MDGGAERHISFPSPLPSDPGHGHSGPGSGASSPTTVELSGGGGGSSRFGGRGSRASSDDDRRSTGSVHSGRSGSRRTRSAAFRYNSLQSYEQGGYLTKPVTATECAGERLGPAGPAWGVAAMQGWRKTMEDAHCFAPMPSPGSLAAAIFDGHAGDSVAKLLASTLPAHLRTAWSELAVSSASADSIAGRLQELLLERDRAALQLQTGGCTGVVVLLSGQRLAVAHCGDARAVLCRAGGALPLTRDHKPADPGEMLRVRLCGGSVDEGRVVVPGVQGSLAVSRAFGDAPFKHQRGSLPEQPVSALADVTVAELQPGDSFVVLACDGIWERVTEQEAVDFVAERCGGDGARALPAERLAQICSELCDHCLGGPPPGRGCDNMTAAIVVLPDPGSWRQPEQPAVESTDQLLLDKWAELTRDGKLAPSHRFRRVWQSVAVEDPIPDAEETLAAGPGITVPAGASDGLLPPVPFVDTIQMPTLSCNLPVPSPMFCSDASGGKDTVGDAPSMVMDSPTAAEHEAAMLGPLTGKMPGGVTIAARRGSLLRDAGVLQVPSHSSPGGPSFSFSQVQSLTTPTNSTYSPPGALLRRPLGLGQAMGRPTAAAEVEALLSPRSLAVSAQSLTQSQNSGPNPLRRRQSSAAAMDKSLTIPPDGEDLAAVRSAAPGAAQRGAALLPVAVAAALLSLALALLSALGGAPAAAAVYGCTAALCVLLVGHSRCKRSLSAGLFESTACCALPLAVIAADVATAGSCSAWGVAVPFVVAAQLGARPAPAITAAAATAVWTAVRTLDESRGTGAWLADLADGAVTTRGSPEWTAAVLLARLFAVVGSALSAGASSRLREDTEPHAAAVLRDITLAARNNDATGVDRAAADAVDPHLRLAAAELAETLRHLLSCVPDGLLQRGDFGRQVPPVGKPSPAAPHLVHTPAAPRRSVLLDGSPTGNGESRERTRSDLSTAFAGRADRRGSHMEAMELPRFGGPRRPSASSVAPGQTVRRGSSMRSSLSEPNGHVLLCNMQPHYCQDWGRPKDATLLQLFLDSESTAQADPTRAAAVFVCSAQVQVQRHSGTTVSVTGTEIAVGWNTHKVCPSHAEQACRCAFGMSRAVPQTSSRDQQLGGRLWYVMALASGTVNVGVVGTQEHRNAVTLGPPVLQAQRLAGLARQLQTRMLASERVYEQVRTRFAGRPVDAVHEGQGPHTAYIVYELLGRRGDGAGLPSRDEHELFVQGFVALRRELFGECREKLLAYAKLRPHDEQAARLLKLCCALMSDSRRCSRSSDNRMPQRYCRTFVGWEEFAQLSDEALDEEVQDVLNRSHGSLSTSGSSDSQEPVEQQLLVANRKRESVKHAAMLRRAIREAEAEANAEELAAWGIMGSQPSQQQTKKKGLPVRFTDYRDRQWQRADKCLGRGAFGEVWMGMSSEGALIAIKSMRLPLLNTMKQEAAAAGRAEEQPAGGAMSAAARRRAAAARRNQQQAPKGPSPRERQQQQLQQIEDLLREVELMQQLQHENIVGYLASAIVDGYIMIVMEYLSGGSLQSVMQEFGAGKLPLTSVQRYLRDIVSGLIFLHFHEIVHRDLKPHNVLLLIDGQCKLADFGASAQLSEMNASTQGVIGTPLYMAPEACRGAVSKASDVWALGIIICQIFSGELPYEFSDDNPFNPQVFMYRLGNTDDFKPTVPNSVPLEARGLVDKCLERDPADRPPVEDIKNEAFLLS